MMCPERTRSMFGGSQSFKLELYACTDECTSSDEFVWMINFIFISDCLLFFGFWCF
jgi:hypothetical protein